MSISLLTAIEVSVAPIPCGVPQAGPSGKLDLGWIPTDNLTLILRHGVDSERVGIIFADGEAWWSTDTKRLWVGDGVTLGGTPQSALIDGSIAAVVARTFL